MTFIPVSQEDALSLRDGADLGPRRACAATPALKKELGEQTSIEEAEFAALSNASVLALFSSWGAMRLVLAAEVGPGQIADPESPHGEVTVSGVSWSQVRALFADEPEAFERVKAVRSAVGDSHDQWTLATVLDAPEVEELLAAYDLLWFAPDELDQLREANEMTECGRNQAN
jgi:L-alanine-DL-glutamate epimerase-like enolase superfamily enzyme